MADGNDKPEETDIEAIHRLLDLGGIPKVMDGKRLNAYDRIDSLLEWRGARRRQQLEEQERAEAARQVAMAATPCALPGCRLGPALKPGCLCLGHNRHARSLGLIDRGVAPPSPEVIRRLQECIDRWVAS